MNDVITEPNLQDADGFYADLLAAHEGLSPEESAALNARLVLVLSNQVGRTDLLRQALEVAKTSS